MNNKDLMNHAADNIRLLAVSMVEKASGELYVRDILSVTLFME